MINFRDALVAVLGAMLIQVITVRWLSNLLLENVNPVKLDPTAAPLTMVFILLFAPPIAGLAWIWLFTVFGESGGWSRLGIRPIRQASIIRALGVGLLAVLLVQIVVSLTPDTLGRPGKPFLSFDLEVADSVVLYRLAYALGAAALAPLFEEVLFRGLLFTWLRGRFSFLVSAIVAALPHAALHGDPAAMPALTATFVLFAWIYEREGTLWAAITAHSAYNLAVLMLLLA